MNGRQTSSGSEIDDATALGLEEFALACGADIGFVQSLVDEGLLSPSMQAPDWRFAGDALLRARRVLRLQRDFEASLPSVALIIELLDEVDRLRRVMHRAGISPD